MRHSAIWWSCSAPPTTIRSGLAFWAWFAKRPAVYGLAAALAMLGLRIAGAFRGRFRWLPLASGWTKHRDFPRPEGLSFQAQWKQGRRR